MENIWPYLVVLLVGFIAGMITEEKIGVNIVYKGQVRIKQRGRYNRQDGQLDLDMGKKPGKAGRLRQMLNRRKAKKEAKKLLKSK